MRKNLWFILKFLLVVNLAATVFLPNLAIAKLGSQENITSLNAAELENQDQTAKNLLEEAISNLKQLPYPEGDETPLTDDRIKLSILSLEKAVDGTFEIGNKVSSDTVFEESSQAIEGLNFYINNPNIPNEYKGKIEIILDKIVEANRIVANDLLNNLDGDIEDYPQKYKSQLKNAFHFYDKGMEFSNDHNQKQKVHFFQKAWLGANAILKEREETTDRDADGIDDAIEKKLGLKTNKEDSDHDGLADGYELYVTFTDPLKKDSDSNGIDDGDEDIDKDGLSNIEEQSHKTNPWAEDSDFDGLDDAFELKEFNSNPLLQDSDHDGLDDESEYRLGMDPTNSDTDGDGILDGLEEYTHEINDPETNVELDITGEGDLAKSIQIDDVSEESIFEEMDALVSKPVNIEVREDFSTATLKIPFDESKIPNGDVDNVKMFYFNEESMTFVPLNNQGVDVENGYVWGETDHFSTYVLFYVPTWQTKWEAPLETGDNRGGDGEELKNIDLMFVLDSSGSMYDNDPSGYRKIASKSFVDALIEGDRAGVVDFDYTAKLLQPLTSDLNAVKSSIDRIDSSGGTDIGAGVRTANNHLIQNSSDDNIKMEILLTDGEGSYSSSLTTQAKENNIIIYTVGLGSGVDANLLSSIAQGTGGQYFPVSSAEDLPSVFSRISGEVGDAVDTDGDGIPDNVELNGWRDGSGKLHFTLPDNPDTDGDGLLDGEEGGTIKLTGVYGEYYLTTSDPNKWDTDGDGLSDYEEKNGGSSEYYTDTDFDGINDNDDDNPLTYDFVDTATEIAKLTGYFAKGLGLGVKDAGLDAWEAITHPVQTGEAIYQVSKLLAMYHITKDPSYLQPLIDAFGQELEEEIDKWNEGDRYERAEQIGYNISGLLLSAIGTKGIDKVLKLLKAAPDIPNLPDLPSYADEMVEWTKEYDVWSLASLTRGKEIDEFLGNNLGITFPVVDKLDNRILTSIKSLDPRSATYTDSPKRMYDRIVEDLKKLDQFTEASKNVTLYDGTKTFSSVTTRSYDKKVLQVVLPDHELTDAQAEYITAAKEYAETLNNFKDVELQVTILK
ncbi:VWA domain-containing protein [Rossellomorea aquimaris]|uniref:VWA domain-containing protein n=1 Tax=Rossellomorea aquimaris TaxID=189382 RepID=UPI0037C79564